MKAEDKLNSAKLKVCGMRDAENVRTIAKIKPDFLGLIFYEKSPRFISLEKARVLPRFDNIKRVGVFVDETVEKMLVTAYEAELYALQLHGNESPKICLELKSKNEELKIIKAFSVDENFDGTKLEMYVNACDYFLFDTKTPKYGGSGVEFDWRILHKFLIGKPFFLSGGIGAENVANAIKACVNLPLFAIDVNSRAEISAGVKSPQIIAEIRNKI